MQLKKIAKICRNEKEIRVLKIMNDSGEIVRSFVGTKYALFAVDDLTDLSKDVMLTIFDVPKTDRNAWTYAEDLRADYEPLEDTWPEKLAAAAVPTGLWIRYKGEEVCEFAVKEVRRLYINPAYLTPLQDELKNGGIAYSERVINGNQSGILTVTNGLCITVACIAGAVLTGEFRNALHSSSHALYLEAGK